MDAEKLAELKAKVGARAVGTGERGTSKPPPPKKLAGVKKVPPAKKQGAAVSTRADGKEAGTRRESTIIPGTNHGTVLCKCKNSKCVEYGERKMIRVPMIGKVLFLPGEVVCAECMVGMEWSAQDVHVDRVPSGD